jgi:pimeloyl-ACP methyl ester carboxylesterase
VLSGTDDTTVPLKNQADMAQGIRGAIQTRISSAGHAAIIDHPNEVNAALAVFLRPDRAAG